MSMADPPPYRPASGVPLRPGRSVAERERAIASDVPGAPFSHVGEACSFDMFMERFDLRDSALAHLAVIVRGADTDRHVLAPEAAGLHAISLGLALTHEDDQALLEKGLLIYDALHAWCARGQGERHKWRPNT
jgi:hypothetical protein